MGKSLRDYITESEQWIDNPVPGDDFAINFREECLVESYVLETRKNAVVIQADEEMIRIMESYGCSMEDLDEEQSVDDVLVSEDPTEEEPTAPGTMGAVDEPTDYDPIGEDFMGRMLELAGCGRKTMEGDISQIEKDIADAPVAPMGTIEEGMMSEIDIDLHALASRGDEEDLIAALEGDLGPGTAVVLQNMMDELKDELAAKGMNDVMNDQDKMIEILWDKIVDEYSDGDFETEEMSEAEYQGRKVKLGKPFLTPGGPKKRAVYVKNPKGNIVKVTFGDPNMKIKKSNPARRKSFRARHRCENPGPRHKARYWSCRAW